jgi:hypothetical protein
MENSGEPDAGFEIVFGDASEEEEDEPNTAGRFGRDAGSVL